MLHPAVLASLTLLLVNDHVLKDAAVGTALDVVTGKLSDFAGLAFFPVLLFSLVELVTRRAPASKRVVIGSVLLTAIVFALTKTFAPAADAYRLAIAVLQYPVHGRLVEVRHVVDPTDLIALPAVALAMLVSARRR
jgi:hypothetical protein